VGFQISKQIGKRRYSTETARLVDSMKVPGWNEELYLKKNGEYFVVGVGDSFPEGIVRPLSTEEADGWLVKATGRGIQTREDERDETPVQMSFFTQSWIREAVRRRAAERGVTIGDVITDAIRSYLEQA